MLTKCKEIGCYNDGTTTGGWCPLHAKHVLPKEGYHGHTKPRTAVPHLGAELECVGANATVEKAMRACGVVAHTDGSLRHGIGCEFKLCHPAEKALKIIPEFADRLHSVGARVNGTCGFHVHLDARGISLQRKQEFKEWMRRYETWWFSLIPPSRRNNHMVAKISEGGHYAWFNWTSYHTGEIRLHPGTLNSHKIRGWLAVCRDLLNLLHAKDEFGVYKPLPDLQVALAPGQATSVLRVDSERGTSIAPAVGSTLTKVYNGVTHQVEVTPTGFRYNGIEWKSLSAIARSIVGYRISGLMWFGVKDAPVVPTVVQPAVGTATGIFSAEATEYIQARLAGGGTLRPTTIATPSGPSDEIEF